MQKETAPIPTEGGERGTLDFRTVQLLAGVKDGSRAEGCNEEPRSEELFELTSQVGLRPVASRHTPGKPVTGTGGTPAVDWVFCSTPYRNQAKDALGYLLPGVSPGDVRTWIRDLLSPLTLWVLDLPGSESYHHAYPHGLLDHMLEVALAATMECSSKMGPAHRRGDLSARAYGHALRLSLLLGCLHDIGKLFSVEVKEKNGEIWDPMREPLAYFKARHKLPILEPTPFRFIKGRGLNGHEHKGRKLIPLVLHPRIWKRMGPDITKAYDAYVCRYESPAVARPAPLDFIADCVHRADGASTAKSRPKGTKPGEYLLELSAKVTEVASA